MKIIHWYLNMFNHNFDRVNANILKQICPKTNERNVSVRSNTAAIN